MLSYPPTSSHHSPQASLCASPLSSSSVHSAPPSSPSSSPTSKRRPLPRLTPASVLLMKSRMAAVHLSSPNSCAIEVFRAVRFLPVAFFTSCYMVACCSFQRLQCLRRCSREGPAADSFEHHQPLSSMAWPTSARWGPIGALFIQTGRSGKRLSFGRMRHLDPYAVHPGGGNSVFRGTLLKPA
jgi:hypothetical protein